MNKIIITLALGAILVPSLSMASIDTNLQYGMQNTEVSELQDFLVTKGYMNVSTGFFGLLTLNAVEKYQGDNDIPNTGYVGTLTRAQVNKELVSDTSASTQAAIDETGTSTPVFICPVGFTCIPVGQSIITDQVNTQVQNTPSQPIQNTNINTNNTVVTPPSSPTFSFSDAEICPKIGTGTNDVNGNPKYYPPLTIVPLNVSGGFYQAILTYSTQAGNGSASYQSGGVMNPLFGIWHTSTSTENVNYILQFKDQSGGTILSNSGSVNLPGICQ